MEAGAVHITRWGHSGPRVVMVHGSALGSEAGGDRHFSVQQRLAERGWQLVVPDRPGHGRSPPPGRPDDAEADGEWVADLLGDGAHLVGHSFGGCVALSAAARRPSAVRSLTLIEPGMQKLATHDPHVRRFSMSAASRAKRSAKVLGIPPEIMEATNQQELARIGHGLIRLKLPSKAALQRELSVVKRERIPLLVVTGGWSPAFEVTADTVASHGNGHRVVIKSEHHFPHQVSNDFNQVLENFMKEPEAVRLPRSPD